VRDSTRRVLYEEYEYIGGLSSKRACAIRDCLVNQPAGTIRKCRDGATASIDWSEW